MNTLPSHPTKPDEIRFINTLANSVPLASYLARLFTPEFVSWVVNHIDQDLDMDIHAYAAAHTAAIVNQTQIAQLQADLAEAVKVINHAHHDLINARTAHEEAEAQACAEIDSRDHQIMDLQDTCDFLHDEINRTLQRVADLTTVLDHLRHDDRVPSSVVESLIDLLPSFDSPVVKVS